MGGKFVASTWVTGGPNAAAAETVRHHDNAVVMRCGTR
jgi:hypothetical protein